MKGKGRLRVFLLGALWLAAPARGADYVIDFWDAARGLPGNSATAIAQTPEGYLWIGTYDGLARFDGIRFVTFDPSNTPALKHPRIERLFTDQTGTLWINTHDGSLTSWRNGVFTPEWTASERVESGVWLVSSNAREQVFVLQSGVVLRRGLGAAGPGPWQVIRSPKAAFSAVFCVTRSGALWIRSRDERLWRLTEAGVDEIPLGPALAGRVIHALTVDPDDRVFVATDREIGRWTGNAFARATPKNPTPSVDVTFLHFNRDGSFWAVADGRLKKGREEAWLLDAGPTRYLLEDILQALPPVEDGRGGTWFGYGGQGLLHVDADGSVRRLGHADGFASERVVSLFHDREDNLWVSVDRGGLARVREQRFEGVSVPRESAGYATISVSEDRTGSVWIGTAGGGLARFRDGRLTSFPLPSTAARAFVVSVVPDGDRLWMSADLEDLWVFDGLAPRPSPWPVHGIKALLVDHAGALWMGRRDGLARLANGRLEHFGPGQGMSITDVRAIAEDAAGTVWIGGGDGTIHRYRDGRFEGVETGMKEGAFPIWSLRAGSDRTLWAGSYGGGLTGIRDGKVTRYTTREGLGSDVVCQILEDEQGHLWVGSREGILRVSKESLAAVAEGRAKVLASSTYGRADGLPPLECSGFQPGSWRGRDGRLWFATTRGAISVSPATLRDNPVPPPVVIEEAAVDRVARDAVALETAGSEGSGPTLVVPAGSREIQFRYTGLSLAAPEAVKFRYRLLGLEPDWVDAGERRTAQYSYVPPGDYRFQVMASNSDGVWNAQGSSLVVKVLPHAWETLWFRAAFVIFSLAAAAFIARHLSTRSLHQNLRLLAQQHAIEADRTRIAKDIHDDLGAGLTQISLLSELLRDDHPPEARAHAEQIGETAAELTRAMDEIVWAVNPSEDTLESLWDYITHYAQEYLASAGIACRLESPGVIERHPLRAEVRHNVFLAVKEALNNVVKHAEAHEVRLVLEADAVEFVIEIQDDGCGRGASRSQNAGRVGSGHGLRNIDERMLSIGARFHISDGPAGGTRVRLSARTR